MKTSEWLKKYDIKLKKSLGQNFLNNSRIASEIAKRAQITKDDTIIEIGTGNGVLTEEIAKRSKRVISYEIDERLRPLLEERFMNFENVEIYFEDFLGSDLSKYKNIEKLKYVANIPYYISSKILEKIFQESPKFDFAIFMFQKEYAERLMAISKKDYSPLSIFVQIYCKVEKIMDVSKSNFIPIPQVDSVVLKFISTERYVKEIEPEKFMKFVHQCFSSRRKTIKNNLKSVISDPDCLLKELSIESNTRPEAISIAKYIEMYKKIFSYDPNIF